MPANKCVRSPNTTSGQQVTLETCGTGTNFLWIFEEQGFVAENTGSGSWTAPATVPLIPAAGALLPNRKVLVWSSWKPYRFAGSGSLDQTIMALFDPANPGAATARTITNTTHNMFCPGIAMLPDGDVFVNGGDDSHTRTTSIYNLADRQLDAPGGDGGIALVQQQRHPARRAGVHAGGQPHLGPERHRRDLEPGNTPGRSRAGPRIGAITSGQPASSRAMEHPRLLIAPDGKIFVPGPTNMQWYDVAGSGHHRRRQPRRRRGQPERHHGDVRRGQDPQGGRQHQLRPRHTLVVITPAANYSPSSQNSYVIDINGGGTAVVTKSAPMKWPRNFGNGVVLANGQVVAVGGLTTARASATTAPSGRPSCSTRPPSTWTELPPMDKPRPYHSIALLLADGRVLVGGGGLCSCSDNCAVNHPDVEILSPPYLFSGTRPGQPTAPGTVTTGSTFSVTVSGTVTGFSLVRLAGVTHSTNTDQRFMRLSFSGSGGTYSVQAPANKNIAPPGYYLLFALNGQAPSTQAAMVRVQ